MDDKPFRYVGGEFHYFRALPQSWPKILRNMRAAGLNVVSTYVEWSLHNPKENVYVWDGIADLIKFINLAHAENLYVILRPGPYICAERDMVCSSVVIARSFFHNVLYDCRCRVDFPLGYCIIIRKFSCEPLIPVNIF